MWRLARALPLAPLREFEKKTRGLPRTTETERLVVQRVAQDVFRGALRDYWGGRCAITGCAEPLLLRASHIKPWAVRDRRRATRCLQWSAVGCSYRCRVRHKVLQSRQRGLWMGGHAPLGYVVQDRKLVIDETEGALGRHIFERFPKVGSAIKLVQEVNAAGHRTKRKAFDKGILYKLLHNRTYVGEVEHKGIAYPGEQELELLEPRSEPVAIGVVLAPPRRPYRRTCDRLRLCSSSGPSCKISNRSETWTRPSGSIPIRWLSKAA
jgi:hypothetical protein